MQLSGWHALGHQNWTHKRPDDPCLSLLMRVQIAVFVSDLAKSHKEKYLGPHSTVLQCLISRQNGTLQLLDIYFHNHSHYPRSTYSISQPKHHNHPQDHFPPRTLPHARHQHTSLPNLHRLFRPTPPHPQRTFPLPRLHNPILHHQIPSRGIRRPSHPFQNIEMDVRSPVHQYE